MLGLVDSLWRSFVSFAQNDPPKKEGKKKGRKRRTPNREEVSSSSASSFLKPRSFQAASSKLARLCVFALLGLPSLLLSNL